MYFPRSTPTLFTTRKKKKKKIKCQSYSNQFKSLIKYPFYHSFNDPL